jgi:spermidine/putrescine transport system substrate-binding protein
MKIAMVSWAMRTLIVIWWSAVIALFLILPSLINYVLPDRSITIFTWPLLLDPLYLKNFERETGIKVHIAYFENGAGLLSKLLTTHGKGYDLIIPDDHSLEVLMNKGLVKKLDKEKLPFLDQIEPALQNHYYDPANEYSIPYYWGVYGIGYNVKKIPELSDTSWQPLFDEELIARNRVCISDDPREAIMIAALYLFGNLEALRDKENQKKVVQLLIDQKKYVEVYTSSRADSLLQNQSCALASIMSPEFLRLADTSHIKMAVPQKDAVIVVDSIAIPKETKKDDLVYQFLNYLYRPEVVAHHVKSFGYCSPLKGSDSSYFCPLDRFNDFHFFKEILSDELINELWVEVLAA